MKYLLQLGALALLIASSLMLESPTFATPRRRTHQKKTASSIIVPGKSIGTLRLGLDADRLPKSFGKSILGDGAAGHIWATYRWDKGLLDIYSVLAEDGPHRARQLRTTSKAFHTKYGVANGKSFGTIKRRFPHLTRLATYTSHRFGKRVVMYDDVKRGIAFEILRGRGRRVSNTNRCVSILIHKPGSKADQETLSPVNYPPLQTN